MFTHSDFNNDREKLLLSIETLKISIAELENLDVSQEGVFSSITGVFSNAFNSLRLTVSNLFKQEQKAVVLNEGFVRNLSSSKMKSNYTYLIDRQVPVPTGMTNTYLEYSTQSLTLVDCIKDVPQIVEQLRAGVGRVLSTENGLKDSTLFSDDIFTNKEKEYNKLTAGLTNMRTGDDFNSVRAYGDVFRNNNELFQTIDVVRNANNTVNSINRAKVMSSIDATMVYIKELSEVAKNQGYSKPLIVKITNAVRAVAVLVEGLAVITFNQEMVTRGLNGTIENISRLH